MRGEGRDEKKGKVELGRSDESEIRDHSEEGGEREG